ncbi:MAG TPA: hypothetical protein VFP54_06435 [Acidimicrobiales bacterium]|nr:hypothetical protein [Acidimicrobiales bacterium]
MSRRSGLTRLRTLLGACLALAAVAAGCGSSHPRSVARTATTTTDPEAAAVLTAYRAEQAAFTAAVDRADPTWPGLAETMTGAQLDSVKRSLVADQISGVVGRGSVQLHPKVASLNGNQAVVLDCAFDSSELVYAKTGKPVPPVTPPGPVAIRSTLLEVQPAVWKVAQQDTKDGPCPAGY